MCSTLAFIVTRHVKIMVKELFFSPRPAVAYTLIRRTALKGKKKNEMGYWFQLVLIEISSALWKTSCVHDHTPSQKGLFINAIFPYIPSYIHGNRIRICKVERCFREKAGVFSFTLSHQIKRTNKSHRIHQTSSLRGAKFRCRKTSPKSKQQRLSSSCRLRERSIIWNGTRTPIQSKEEDGGISSCFCSNRRPPPSLPSSFSLQAYVWPLTRACYAGWPSVWLFWTPYGQQSSGVQEGTAIGKRVQ